MTETQSTIDTDIKNYIIGLKSNNTTLCASIEQKYEVYGLPPQMVSEELQRVKEIENYYSSL